ncbi:DNA topoisomerase IB [Agromyces atrinae]|uniref:DNA topoisomerase n=1 Tax=Agromyces atrinae TaxID=592376 RepID=A0A4Q2MBW2_9MICO|nr:DNA topoisomerase IB [Agromyces atrinae]NYD67852.1 DNA topoisomerase-1 [Agromyces atrinae]RXZ87973.1 DNA topoisomerase IB [Agromyces atrinae]
MRLKRVQPYSSSGYTRRRDGERFRYRDADGKPVDADERRRVIELAIPPAWNKVWISDRANAHILAVGVDAAGRRQYIYHPEWRRVRDGEKFERARRLAESLPGARTGVTRALRGDELTRDRVLAAAFRLLDTVAIRAGGESYLAENGTHGLTTLLGRHVSISGSTVQLRFPAKSGVAAEVEVVDDDLARCLGEARRSPRTRLLAWKDGSKRVPITTIDLNAYVRERTLGDFTAKDFRTLHGTITAARSLAKQGLASTERERSACIRRAVQAVADELGNTPTVARTSYIDPEVFDRYAAGELIDLSISPDSGILALLGRPGSHGAPAGAA